MSIEAKAEVLKALADPTRLRILQKIALDTTPVPTCEVVIGCSGALTLSQPTVSHHITKLVQTGVLIEQKNAKQKSYRLNNDLLQTLGIDIHLLTKQENI